MLKILLLALIAIPTVHADHDLRLGRGIHNSKGERLVPFCREFDESGKGCNRVRVKYYAKDEALTADGGTDFGVEFPGYYFDRAQYEKMVASDPRVVPENTEPSLKWTHRVIFKNFATKAYGVAAFVVGGYHLMALVLEPELYKQDMFPVLKWSLLLVAPVAALIATDIVAHSIPKYVENVSNGSRNQKRTKKLMQAYEAAMRRDLENWTSDQSTKRVRNWIFNEWVVFLKSTHLREQLSHANLPSPGVEVKTP